MSNESEARAERAPTPEEVLSLLERMAGVSFRETQRFVDVQGRLCRLDVVVEGLEGGRSLEFHYSLRGNHANGDASDVTIIHSLYVDDSGPGPEGPEANLVDGEIGRAEVESN